MTYRIVNTDNFGRDYPDEKFVEDEDGPMEFDIQALANACAAEMNGPYPEHSSRYFKVVEMPYELAPGFEP